MNTKRFRVGQEIEIVQPHSRKSGAVKVREVLSDTEIIVSQSLSEKEKAALHPNEVIRILIEKGGTVNFLQGMVETLEADDMAKWRSSDNETIYRIKNIFFKRQHPKRKAERKRPKWVRKLFQKRTFSLKNYGKA